MGFESKITGFIAVQCTGKPREEMIQNIERSISALPRLQDDQFPYLPREVFAISKLANGENLVPIAYRSIMVHFGISMKQLDEAIRVWIDKFERFLLNMPGAWEAIVQIEMAPYTANYKMRRLSYHWFKEFKPKTYESFWRFEGDARNWEELREHNFGPGK